MENKAVEKFKGWREDIYLIIFEADSPKGKLFDIVLLIFILFSVLAVMLESVPSLQPYATTFYVLEWIFTVFFTMEYALRLFSAYKPYRYATSVWGIIDLLAILPTYLSIFILHTNYLLVIRALRLLRIFRIFKLTQFLDESKTISNALKASRAKITVFLVFVLLVVIIIGSVMYLIEGGQPDTQFTSIPKSIYWAIVTITTVGYGDIAPTTNIGQFLAAILMIMGYGVIAVPTGIVSAEVAYSDKGQGKEETDENYNYTRICSYCGKEGHNRSARFCMNCAEKLNPRYKIIEGDDEISSGVYD